MLFGAKTKDEQVHINGLSSAVRKRDDLSALGSYRLSDGYFPFLLGVQRRFHLAEISSINEEAVFKKMMYKYY